MAVAHQAGVIHRDLKPANILVNDEGLLKIVDFGVAAAASSGDTQLTKTGYVIGSPKYMAPEQILGKKVDDTADIYSLGVIMYEMLTGIPPYSRGDHMSVMYQHVQGKAQAVPGNQPGDSGPALLPSMSCEQALHGQCDKNQALSALWIELRRSSGSQIAPRISATASIDTTMARIDAFLKLGLAQGCSDIHLAVGVPPMLRMNGDLMPIKFRAVGAIPNWKPTSTKSCHNNQQERLHAGHDLDFSYVAEEGGRFRVNVFRKDTGIGAVFRHIPGEVPTLDKLNVPAGTDEILRLPSGHGAGDRLHRHRQIDHAGGDDRLT